MEKRGFCRTYLIFENSSFIAYFTIALKILEFSLDVSTTRKKKLNAKKTDINTIAYLIGQLGKNDIGNSRINITDILKWTYTILSECHDLVGGRVILLECENHPKLIDLYEKNGFKFLQMTSNASGKEMIQFTIDVW